jgi:CubicO group peptidase (beta-lactamase class C family)
MTDTLDELDELAAATGFSGVVRVDRADGTHRTKAYGLAHRGHRIVNTPDTRFAIASGSKSLTALTVVSLIESGQLDPSTTARDVLGTDLPLIDDTVTVEHLLAHRSGIGDYLDEDSDKAVDDYVLPIPVHELATTEPFIRALDGYPTKFPPDEQFSYCNAGYVVLALIAERASKTPFHDLVHQRVCEPAGMTDTEYLRADEPDARTALGYLTQDGLRTNVLHLPVRGTGDGGAYSTAADIHTLWRAFFAGRIISNKWVNEMVRPRSEVPQESMRYGLGFWLHESRDIPILIGFDAGVSFRTVHNPTTNLTYTVMSNTSGGAWPIARHLDQRLRYS